MRASPSEGPLIDADVARRKGIVLIGQRLSRTMFRPGFTRIVEENSSYYLLGYTSKDASATAGSAGSASRSRVQDWTCGRGRAAPDRGRCRRSFA